MADFSEARDGLGACVGAEFREGVLEVRAYRAGGDEQLSGDLAVGHAIADEAEHLEFASG